MGGRCDLARVRVRVRVRVRFRVRVRVRVRHRVATEASGELLGCRLHA